MWPTLALFALLALGLTQWAWRRRCRELQRRLDRAAARELTLQEQQRLAEAEARAQQQTVFDSMVEGVLVLDADRRIRLANAAAARLFGLSAQARGQTLIEALRLAEVQDLAERAAREGQVLNYELQLPGLDRRVMQINATALRDSQGQSRGLILVSHDLTRLKQLEDTRREFVANVSHELRTPLSLIKGFTETLLSGAKDDPAVTTRFLKTIEKHADRLTFLIEDLLTLSRLEAGQAVLNLQSVELRPLVQGVISDLAGRAAEKGVALEDETPAGLLLFADADRLEQALFNLVENAIKYGRSGGRVAIAGRTREPTRVEIRVQDDGPGIPPEALPRIFERFYRVDKARSREQGGTGLGLAIVKHITQAHGGEVRVESVPGAGATFFLTWPAVPAAASSE